MTGTAAEAVAALDGPKGSALEDAREALIPFGRAIVPHVADGMARFRRAEARAALLYTVIKFAQVEPLAVTAAIAALDDRSSLVRSTACALLAFSLDTGALDALHTRAAVEPRDNVRADIAAAIAAITERQPDLWVDRNRTGQVHWHVGGAVHPG
ncbi:hypothetical protein HKCCE2091_01215 [Rhodobacterales bacterium HKCCE2091]|nr:hypothetical protein [Rhodobacterales bacterium HKCCE2091]